MGVCSNKKPAHAGLVPQYRRLEVGEDAEVDNLRQDHKDLFSFCCVVAQHSMCNSEKTGLARPAHGAGESRDQMKLREACEWVL